MEEKKVLNFGQDVIPLEATDSGLSFKLAKAPENYTCVELMSPELEAHSGFLSRVAVAELSRLTNLRALSIGHLNKQYNDSIHEVFALMTKLRSLKLNKVFSTSFDSFVQHGLILLKSLEELEIYSHPSQHFSENFWKSLGDASAHIKLNRFAFTESVAPGSVRANLENILGALSKFKTLESCKIYLDEFMSSDQLHRDLFLAHLIDTQQFRVLEIGTFDFNNQADRDFVEAVLKACGGLRSFGLKLSHWNPDTAKHLSEMLNRNPGNLSQLILNVATDTDVNFIDFAKDLLKTNILDIRIVQNNVDLTSHNLIEFYKKKITLLLSPRDNSNAEERASDPSADLEALLAKLIQDMSSVAILDHQLMFTMIICLRLDGLSEPASVEHSGKFFEKLYAWIEVGKVSHSFILSFIQTIPGLIYYDFLRLLQLCLNECSQDEIESVIKPTFSRIISERLDVLNEKFEPHFFAKIEKSNDVVDQKALEIILDELNAYVDVLDDPRYRDLLHSAKRDRCKITVSLLKDKIFYCLGRDEYLLKDCIRSQMRNYIESSDENFSVWLGGVIPSFNTEGHYNNDRSPSILRMLLAEISGPQRLILIVKEIVRLYMHISMPKERYILLAQSLAIMRMAMRRGYEDNDGVFEELFNQFVAMKKTVSYGQSKEEIRSAALKEIDVMMDALFQSEVKVEPVKTTLKDLLKKENTEADHVPLRDLLRVQKKEASPSEQPVPLKESLKPKKESDSSLGGFFDGQSRESADDLGTEKGNTPLK